MAGKMNAHVGKSNTVPTEDTTTNSNMEVASVTEAENEDDQQPDSQQPDTQQPDTQQLCRICYGDSTEGTLIQPCNCKGTLEYVHRECLTRWLQERWDMKCEICNVKYCYSWHFLPFFQWRLPKPFLNRELIFPERHQEEIFVQLLSFICTHVLHSFIVPSSFFGLDTSMRQGLLLVIFLLTMMLIVMLSIIKRCISINTVILIMDKRERNVSNQRLRWIL